MYEFVKIEYKFFCYWVFLVDLAVYNNILVLG